MPHPHPSGTGRTGVVVKADGLEAIAGLGLTTEKHSPDLP